MIICTLKFAWDNKIIVVGSCLNVKFGQRRNELVHGSKYLGLMVISFREYLFDKRISGLRYATFGVWDISLSIE